MLAELRKNDLYHIEVNADAIALHLQETAAAAAAYNHDAVDYWHQLTGHLSMQKT